MGERTRKSTEEIINLLFDALERLRWATTTGLARETGMSTFTVEKYMSIICHIQNVRKRMILHRNDQGEFIYELMDGKEGAVEE